MSARARLLVVAAAVLLLASCGGNGTPDASRSVAPGETGGSTAIDRQGRLEAAWERYGSPGVVAVVVDGDQRWEGAAGDADLAGTAATAGMRFRAASITKPIVATIALRLAERGGVALDEPVAPLLPPGILRASPPVTVRQLLGHTAGIFNLGDEGDVIADISAIPDPTIREEGLAFLKRASTDRSVVVPTRVAVAAAETHPRYAEPGTGFHYSNAGYQVAGLVLERATARSLATLLRDEIARPLGLTRTTLAPEDRTSPELRGYETVTTTGERLDSTDDLRAFGNGANGGVLTNTGDLATFFRALLGGRLLPADTLRAMRTPSTAALSAESPYGLGLATYRLSCGTFYGHEGGVAGTASIAMADATGERAVVIAFNQRGIGDPRLPALADDLVCGPGS